MLFKGPRYLIESPRSIKIGNEDIRRVEGTKFLGVWVDEGLKWVTHIERVKAKVSQLLGVIGRARGSLDREAICYLYNGLVLPHLQYCLMVWGDFEGGKNLTIGNSLLRLQKRFVGMIAGKTGLYHADPLFVKGKTLKVADLYRQQLQVYAWQFCNGRLPANHAAMLQRVSEVHRYPTRAAESGLSAISRDNASVCYKVCREWSALPEKLRGLTSLPAFKRQSKELFLKEYRKFECKQASCRVCGRGGLG